MLVENKMSNLEKILSKLDDIELSINAIKHKLDILENQVDAVQNHTSDIHQYVPFVSWLENIGRSISRLPGFLRVTGSEVSYEELCDSSSSSE